MDTKKLGYVLGRQIGTDFVNQGIEVDVESFTASFKSAVAGEKSEMTEEEIREVMVSFQAKMQQKHQAAQGAAAEKNLKEGTAFLEENKKKDGIFETASGLQYRVIQEGTGPKPSATDQVETHYEGRLIDGSVFDSSIQRGETAIFPVNGVIKGWQEALQLMPVGSKWELFIPASIAYGEAGAGGAIPPNATLNFDIELIDIK